MYRCSRKSRLLVSVREDMENIPFSWTEEPKGKNIPFTWTEESKGTLDTPIKRIRKASSKKKEFVGWGSKQLIEFLESIGRDTDKQLSQYDVTNIITEYYTENKLQDSARKKKVNCDEKLRSLFGRKSFYRMKTFDLLDSHFAENQEETDDEMFYSSEEREVDEFTPCKKQKISSVDRKTYQKKKAPETPKSCFAAVICENIKLIYLKRSLVQDLLKDPETFENKVVGSLVRVKSDPNDLFQKNSHQLVQVTGVKKASGNGDINTEFLLQVSNHIKEVLICMLSDENFSEEECEDLRRRVKDGLVKRPTVEELQLKAQILHQDLTKHWLPREISLLQNRIDRANEKGWRRELFDYLERRQLLQTPAEQLRLLHEVPKVMAEEIEPEARVQDFPDTANLGDDDLPNSVLRGASEVPLDVSAANGITSPLIADSTDAADLSDVVIASKVYNWDSPVSNGNASSKEGKGDEPEFSLSKWQKLPVEKMEECNGENEQNNVGGSRHGTVKNQVTAPPVIDLCDDDEEEENENPNGGNPSDENPNGRNPSGENRNGGNHIVLDDDDEECLIWHYMDPQGEVQGPFSVELLKRWSSNNYFPPDFMIWKTGQSQREAVLLSDVLR